MYLLRFYIDNGYSYTLKIRYNPAAINFDGKDRTDTLSIFITYYDLNPGNKRFSEEERDELHFASFIDLNNDREFEFNKTPNTNP